MSDCANVEIRELLPEYMHGRLGAADRARVESHLTGCEDCAAELTTLQTVRRVYSRVPAIDTAAIVRALPKSQRRAQVRSTHRPLAWRIAAAVSFISLGGISLAVARSFFEGASVPPEIVDTAALPRGDSLKVDTQSGGGVRDTRPAISFGGGVDDLKTEDLEQLLSGIESLEAAPPVEPEVVLPTGTGRVRSDTSGGVQ